jgi:hypothetical protein
LSYLQRQKSGRNSKRSRTGRDEKRVFRSGMWTERLEKSVEENLPASAERVFVVWT